MAKFIATAPLFIGRARAANPGDEIPEDIIEKNGWEDSVELVDEDQDEAPAKPAPVKEILAEVGETDRGVCRAERVGDPLGADVGDLGLSLEPLVDHAQRRRHHRVRHLSPSPA